MTPTLRRVHQVLTLAAADPYHFKDSLWWFPNGTEAIGRSSLFWAEAFKLIEPVRDNGQGQWNAVYLSERGKMLLEADPYFELLVAGGGVGGNAPPLLWLLHWWLMSSPCLSKGVQWLFGRSQEPRFTRESLLQKLMEEAGENASATVLKQEVKVLLEMYLPNALAGWEEEFEHPFWALELLRYDEQDVQNQMRQRHPKAYAKYDQAVAQSKSHDALSYRGLERTLLPNLPKPTIAALKKTHIEFNCRFGRLSSSGSSIPAAVMLYTVLDYVQSQVQGNQLLSGCLGLGRVLYESWDCPGIVLRFTEAVFHQAIDQLKRQGQLEGLSIDYLPDAGGNVLAWNQPLAQMQQELWQYMVSTRNA